MKKFEPCDIKIKIQIKVYFRIRSLPELSIGFYFQCIMKLSANSKRNKLGDITETLTEFHLPYRLSFKSKQLDFLTVQEDVIQTEHVASDVMSIFFLKEYLVMNNNSH